MWTDFLRPEQIGENKKQLDTWKRLCQWVDLSKEQSGIHDVWTSQIVLGSSWQSLARSSAMIQGSNCEHGRNRAQQNSREEQTVPLRHTYVSGCVKYYIFKCAFWESRFQMVD